MERSDSMGQRGQSTQVIGYDGQNTGSNNSEKIFLCDTPKSAKCKSRTSKNNTPGTVETPPPTLPSCITNDDMEISYEPENETEEKYRRLVETQNVDMTYRTVRVDSNLD